MEKKRGRGRPKVPDHLKYKPPAISDLSPEEQEKRREGQQARKAASRARQEASGLVKIEFMVPSAIAQKIKNYVAQLLKALD